MDDHDSGDRPYRSKVQRPCDRCRRRKTACVLPINGSCQSCTIAHQTCTFKLPPAKRRRGRSSSHQVHDQNSVTDTPPRVGEASRTIGLSPEELHASPRPTSASAQFHASRNDIPDTPSSSRPDVAAGHGVPGSALISEITPAALQPDPAEESAWQRDPQSRPQSAEFRALGGAQSHNHVLTSHTVQHICSLDQLEGATAQLCGMSAELDPWLLRHCRYNDYGMRRLCGTHIRNVGGVPIQGLVPVHFVVADDSLAGPAKRETAIGPLSDATTKRWELDQLVPFNHGMRLISLFTRFVLPVMPIVSEYQLKENVSAHTYPTILLAAIYASAIPYAVHDPFLFVSGDCNDSLRDRLWRIVYEQYHEEIHTPKLAVAQASLLYLQRLPDAHQQARSDDPSRFSFLGSIVALAMSLGLHLESRPWGIPAWEKRLRRRIWWAIYLEDKWMSLLLGRPPLIRAEEWDVELLDETDFSDIANTAAHPSSIVNDPYCGIIFPYFVKLAQLVEKIHETFYTLKASQRLSEDFRATIDAARNIRASLQTWYSELPDDLRMKPRLNGHHQDRRQGVAALHLSYLTLELFLYRAILRPLARSPPPPPIVPETGFPQAADIAPLLDLAPSPWYLDDLTVGNFEFDQLPAVDFAEYEEAAQATLNAAEKCAGIIVNFVGSLVPKDFDVLWYPWTRICFATITNFIVLLFVQAHTARHAIRSKELLDRWSSHLQSQHKSHESLMTLGVVRLHSLQVEELDRMFILSQPALEVLRDDGFRVG